MEVITIDGVFGRGIATLSTYMSMIEVYTTFSFITSLAERIGVEKGEKWSKSAGKAR